MVKQRWKHITILTLIKNVKHVINLQNRRLFKKKWLEQKREGNQPTYFIPTTLTTVIIIRNDNIISKNINKDI